MPLPCNGYEVGPVGEVVGVKEVRLCLRVCGVVLKGLAEGFGRTHQFNQLNPYSSMWGLPRGGPENPRNHVCESCSAINQHLNNTTVLRQG